MNELSTNLPSLEELRRSFTEGRLKFVVGAGSSIAAGLPGWDDLNASLMERYFNRAASEAESPKFVSFDPDELDALSRTFAKRFGSNSVIDLLREELTDERFEDFLHDSLYSALNDHSLQPLHFELAASVGAKLSNDDEDDALLFTLNYDDVLEQALAQVTGVDPKSIVDDEEWIPNSVVHLHGFLPLDPEKSSPSMDDVILSEKDYHQSRGGRPDEALSALLNDPDSDVLLLGTSLSDPRLRRLLYERVEAMDQGESSRDGKVWVFLTHHDPDPDDDLATRRAEKMASNHVDPFWQTWDVEVIPIHNHEVLPLALRRIRMGGNAQDWLSKGQAFLGDQGVFGDLYDKSRQAKSQLRLIRTIELIQQQFEVELEEDLTLSFYVPGDREDGTVCLQPAFRFADPHRRHTSEGMWQAFPAADHPRISQLSPLVVDGDIRVRCMTKDEAQERQLKVPSVDEAEGATGFATATGIVVDASDERAFFRNFDEEKIAEWSNERTYSSLLSIPVYDTEEWVPIGAACIASVKKTAFWKGLESTELKNLESHMRSTFRNLLDYESHF